MPPIVTGAPAYFSQVAPGFQTTLAATCSAGATTVALNSAGGYSNGALLVLVIDGNNTNLKQVVAGILNTTTSPVTLTNCIWTQGTNQSHLTGAAVWDYVSATDWALAMAGIQQDHNTLGYHKTLRDVNGNTWLHQTAVANAVNYFDIQNNVAGSSPITSVQGSDPNIDYNVATKGSGVFKINSAQVGPQHLLNPHKFSVYWSGSPANYFTTGGNQALFDTKLFDTGNDFSLSTHLFTAPVTGYYKFEASIEFNNGSNPGWIQTMLSLNGSVAYSNLIPASSNAATDANLVTPLLYLTAGTTVGVVGKVSASGGWGATSSTFFSGWLDCLA